MYQGMPGDARCLTLRAGKLLLDHYQVLRLNKISKVK